MAKKKSDGTETLPEPTQEATRSPGEGNGEKPKPRMSWQFPAAAGVNIEVALWPSAIKLQNGAEIEVLYATITRTYRDPQGQWQKGGGFRIAEIPVLIHALLRAHGFGLDSKEMTVPF